MCTLQAGTAQPTGDRIPDVTRSGPGPRGSCARPLRCSLVSAPWPLRSRLSCRLLPVLSVFRRPGDRLPSNARCGGGATPGGSGSMASLRQPLGSSPTSCPPAWTGGSNPPPPLRKALRKHQDLTPASFKMEACNASTHTGRRTPPVCQA